MCFFVNVFPCTILQVWTATFLLEEMLQHLDQYPIIHFLKKLLKLPGGMALFVGLYGIGLYRNLYAADFTQSTGK